MTTSNVRDGRSREVRNISVEEFLRDEFIARFSPSLDIDLILISNGNLNFKTFHDEFLKFSNFITQPLYEDCLKDLLTFVFLHLYLLLLFINGRSDAQKFLRSFKHLPFHSDVLDNLLYDEKCKYVQEFFERRFQSGGRIRVKLSKNAYTTLMKWIEDYFSTSAEMITILRVLHENLLVDISDNADEDSTSNDEVIKEVQSWFERFLKPVKKNTSQFEVKAGTSKTSENWTKSYLDQVKSSRLNMEDMAEALLNPPDIDGADFREELIDIRKMVVAKELFYKDPEKILDESAATAKSAKNKTTCHYLLEFTKAYETDFYAEYPLTVSQYDKISSSDISPNFRYMAIGFESYKICTWRLGGRSIELEPIGTLVGHEGIVSALSIDSKLQCLISGSHDHTVRIWDIERSICTKILSDHFAPVNDVCVSPNSMYFVSASEDKRICLFWYDDIYPKQVFTGHSGKAINCLQIHPSSIYFACAFADGNLFLFQVNVTCPVRMYNKHKCDVYALSFSPLPKHLVSADIEGVIIIWDILTYSPIRILETGHEIRSISYDMSGFFLVATSPFKPFTVYIIEGENADLVAKSKNVPIPKSIYFSNDNRMFAIQSVEADEI